MPIIIYYIENTKLVLNTAQVHPARLRKSKIMRLANYAIISATSTMYLGPDLVTPVAYRWWHLLVQLVEPHKTKHWRCGTASLHTEVCVWSVGAPVSVRVSLGWCAVLCQHWRSIQRCSHSLFKVHLVALKRKPGMCVSIKCNQSKSLLTCVFWSKSTSCIEKIQN